ncbi:dioxygenase family protein [Leisingera sp. ANG-Vp]|uniref:dioxygenase family protein n=1 Tax=Leisingera sp. ANG-Vp TaxID=1577896 RepID=UPI00057D4859|nr:protocatechuate 3,4-dioxygenase [Leisingera sp. ANG-Vp]KIC19935.1 protocatechuate 3,4-dioxygenase [Leisingera sp. ANG-Vp]
MNSGERTRRSTVLGFAALVAGLVFPRKGAATGLTPSAAEGPFYPKPSMRLADADNDLVKVAGLVREAGGEVMSLKGQVTNEGGIPLAGLRIEIWQCDVNGKYLHPSDNRSDARDQGFQGFGHDITDREGNYSFRTIKPTRYPGRTPHIHVKVLEQGRELLTTQFYLKDHPGNDRDGLYRRMSAKQAASVSMEIIAGSNGLEATVNVVI